MKCILSISLLFILGQSYGQYSVALGVDRRSDGLIDLKQHASALRSSSSFYMNDYFFVRGEYMEKKTSQFLEFSLLSKRNLQYYERSDSYSGGGSSPIYHTRKIYSASVFINYLGLRFGMARHFSKTTKNNIHSLILGGMFRADVRLNIGSHDYYYEELRENNSNMQQEYLTTYYEVSTDPFPTYRIPLLYCSAGPKVGYRYTFKNLFLELNLYGGVCFNNRSNNNDSKEIDGYSIFFVESDIGVGWILNKKEK